MTRPRALNFASLPAPAIEAAIAPTLWLRYLRACDSFGASALVRRCVPSSEPSRSANLVCLVDWSISPLGGTLDEGRNRELLRCKAGALSRLESLLSMLSRSAKSLHLLRYASYISTDIVFNSSNHMVQLYIGAPVNGYDRQRMPKNSIDAQLGASRKLPYVLGFSPSHMCIGTKLPVTMHSGRALEFPLRMHCMSNAVKYQWKIDLAAQYIRLPSCIWHTRHSAHAHSA